MGLSGVHTYFTWLAEALQPRAVVHSVLRYWPVIQRTALKSRSRMEHNPAAQSQSERQPRHFHLSLSRVVHELGLLCRSDCRFVSWDDCRTTGIITIHNGHCRFFLLMGVIVPCLAYHQVISTIRDKTRGSPNDD